MLRKCKNFFKNVGIRLKLEIRMNNLNKKPKNEYGMETISRSVLYQEQN